jgi:hypothetical protein
MPHQATPEARVFTSRALVDELFEADAPDNAWRSIPFSVYLRQTPATPLSGLTKSLLWAAGALVVVVLVAAIARAGREMPRSMHRPAAEAISALESEDP